MLGVAGADLLESLPEQGKLENVAARVHLPDGLLLGGAIALLDNAEEPTGRIAENPAEPHGVMHLGSAEQAGRSIMLLARQKIGQGFGPQERLVADQDHDRALIIGQVLAADFHGMARSKLLDWVTKRMSGSPRRLSRTWSAA